MIDFVSTRVSTDPATRAAAQLIAAGIAQFLRDASQKPTREEQERHRNLKWSALSAIEYLFGKGSSFEDHIEMLGGTAAPFRAALLDDRPLQENGPFTHYQRRIIQARYRWWTADPAFVPEQPEEIEP